MSEVPRAFETAFDPRDVIKVEPYGKLEVQLNGGALVRPPERIHDLKTTQFRSDRKDYESIALNINQNNGPLMCRS